MKSIYTEQYRQIGLKIAYYRKLRGLTQKVLAEQVGLTLAYIGHLKAVRYDTLMEQRPTKAMELAVKGMIPSTTIGRAALTRLRLFDGAEHKHAAQKPAAWEL